MGATASSAGFSYGRRFSRRREERKREKKNDYENMLARLTFRQRYVIMNDISFLHFFRQLHFTIDESNLTLVTVKSEFSLPILYMYIVDKNNNYYRARSKVRV